MFGYGAWKDSKHIVGGRNMRMEKEIYGEADDPSKQHTGINFKKYNDIPVEATGADVPEPVTSFTNPPLDPVLLENITYARYTTPTPTGSGKTGGFPSFTVGPCAVIGEPMGYGGRCRATLTALILAPTRELISQIHDEARQFAYRSWVRPVVVYGGADISPQICLIERGCDLLTATPGRLVDLIERDQISLANVKYLVLDGADRMLDMGFEPQIRRIVQGEDVPSGYIPPRYPNPRHKDFLKDYIFLSVGRVRSTSKNITQKFEYVEDNDKRSVLLDILNSHSNESAGLTLILVETVLSGNGQTPITVATAIAARGLDIPNVTHVVNYSSFCSTAALLLKRSTSRNLNPGIPAIHSLRRHFIGHGLSEHQAVKEEVEPGLAMDHRVIRCR
ncbi:P-loop containing nucleoside triphosphate hydrolase protein [Lentinula edodes]|nr:P-loop containing nucleoside triphosphate hydrolase protein [Lentinula edodes]